MEIPDGYVKLRSKSNMHRVSLGCDGVVLFKAEELERKQIGYSIDSAGRSLVSHKEGYWKDNWLVIGYEDNCGDPLFIDISQKGYPVYTAMSGVGEWVPIMINDSFEKFLQAFSLIRRLSDGRETPEALKSNRIPEYAKGQVIKKIKLDNPYSDTFFWESWLEQDL